MTVALTKPLSHDTRFTQTSLVLLLHNPQQASIIPIAGPQTTHDAGNSILTGLNSFEDVGKRWLIARLLLVFGRGDVLQSVSVSILRWQNTDDPLYRCRQVRSVTLAQHLSYILSGVLARLAGRVVSFFSRYHLCEVCVWLGRVQFEPGFRYRTQSLVLVPCRWTPTVFFL